MKSKSLGKEQKIGLLGKPVLLTVIIVFPLTVLLGAYLLISQLQRNRDKAYYLVDGVAEKLENAIETRVIDTDIFENLVISNGGEIKDFNTIAKKMCENDSALRSIQLAPDGVIEYAYPVISNEEGIIDIFKDPDRKEEALWAKDTGQTTLSGPYKLLQGGMGIVIRNPIYLSDGNGKDVFWGFSIAVVNVPNIFEVADIDELDKENYSYSVHRHVPNTEEIATIYTNTDKPVGDAITVNINVPNSDWHLSVCPKDGWMSLATIFDEIIAIIVFAVLLSAVSAVFFTLLKQNRELKNQVYTDVLTGIYNYRFFDKKLKELSSTKAPFALFYIDIVNLMQICEKYGHKEVDTLINEISFRIKQSIGNKGCPIRMGREEFALIIPSDESEDSCEDLKTKLKSYISLPYELFDRTFTPNAIVGYARFPFDSANPDKIQWLADKRKLADGEYKRQ